MERKRSSVTGLLAVAAAALLAACGGDSASLTGAPSPAALVGPTWRLTLLNGQPVLDGTTVTAEFTAASRVGGKASCNQYTGYAQAETGGRLAVGQLASTLMACSPQGVLDQETRYLATLQAATRYDIRGEELRLGTSATDVTLVFTSR